MGEIRSTLDIVMEKTSGLTLSDEEKRSVKKTEIEGKVKGLLQKYSDHVISIEKLKREIDDLDKGRENIKEILLRLCAARIKPETDNTSIIDLLSYVAGLDPTPLETMLQGLHQDLAHKKAIYEKGLTEQLKEQGISGGAVIPNLSADPEWIRFLTEANDGFRDQLDSFVQEITPDI